MGADTAEALTDLDPAVAIEDTRARLERDLAVLQARLPDRDAAVKVAALSAGGATAAVGALWFVWSRHARAKDRRYLVRLLREAGLEASSEPTPANGGGSWKLLLPAIAAGLMGARAIAASRTDASAP